MKTYTKCLLALPLLLLWQGCKLSEPNKINIKIDESKTTELTSKENPEQSDPSLKTNEQTSNSSNGFNDNNISIDSDMTSQSNVNKTSTQNTSMDSGTDPNTNTVTSTQPDPPLVGTGPSVKEIAENLQPGEWAEVQDARPENLLGVLTGYSDTGKEIRYHIAGWTDDAHWDSKSKKFHFMGFRKQYKFISYSDSSRSWQELENPFGWDSDLPGTFEDTRTTQFGHVYGGNAFDPDGQNFYRYINGFTYKYNVNSELWTRFAGGNGMSIEFFPGLGLIAHSVNTNANGKYNIELFDESAQIWKVVGELPFSGYHALCRYNPILDEMLFIAGNNSRAIAKMNRNGEMTLLKNVPFDMSIRQGKLIVEPTSGRYLLVEDNIDEDRYYEMFEFDSQTNTYTEIPGFNPPWGVYEMPVPAAIPEHGVIMFLGNKTLIYKHKLSGAN